MIEATSQSFGDGTCATLMHGKAANMLTPKGQSGDKQRRIVSEERSALEANRPLNSPAFDQVSPGRDIQQRCDLYDHFSLH